MILVISLKHLSLKLYQNERLIVHYRGDPGNRMVIWSVYSPFWWRLNSHTISYSYYSCTFRSNPESLTNLEYLNLNTLIMRGLLYIIAVILVIGWIFGFFFNHAGSLIHVLLVIAIIAVLLGVIRRA
jgi:hypothetical protein